jgi:hypothetical protein
MPLKYRKKNGKTRAKANNKPSNTKTPIHNSDNIPGDTPEGSSLQDLPLAPLQASASSNSIDSMNLSQKTVCTCFLSLSEPFSENFTNIMVITPL